jgi:hypothetical protein
MAMNGQGQTPICRTWLPGNPHCGDAVTEKVILKILSQTPLPVSTCFSLTAAQYRGITTTPE